MNTNVVEIQQISKDIGGTTILKDINITVERGKAYGIVGRNGSGKSMLFKAICGLVNITTGEIRVFGDIIKDGKFPKDTGIIIEKPGFLPQYSAFNNLKILASIKKQIDDEKIRKTLLLVGLDPLNKKQVKKFSLGMKQRLGIAQALMEDPKLLILDEPMNGLDADGVKQIRSILLELKAKGVAILLASHNEDDINEISDYIYQMNDGKLSEILR